MLRRAKLRVPFERQGQCLGSLLRVLGDLSQLISLELGLCPPPDLLHMLVLKLALFLG